MKKYALSIIILIMFSFNVFADIYNGYQKEIYDLQRELNDLTVEILRLNKSKDIKKVIRKKKSVEKEFELIEKLHNETNNLLDKFKSIDPEMFNSVSTVANAEGTLTNVYVKIVEGNSKLFKDRKSKGFKLFGYTNLSYWNKNPNVHASAYGAYTVSVVVTLNSYSLRTLAHEFGHVLYQVKNLKQYTEFCRREYDENQPTRFKLGHKPLDPSNEFIRNVERRFRIKHRAYLKSQKKTV